MLIRQTLLYLPAQLLGPLLQFAAVITLTHYLLPADYGLTMLIFTTQELIFLATLSWWTFYVLRYGGQFEDEAARKRLRDTQASVLAAAGVVQVIATLVLVGVSFGRMSAPFLAVAVAFVLTRSFLGFLSEYARSEVRIADVSVIQIAPPLLGLVLSVLMLEGEGARPGIVLAAFALVQAGVALVMGVRLGVLSLPRRPDGAILKASLSFGLTMILAGALIWVCSNSIRFVVQHLGGAEALGLLSVAWGIAQRLAAMAGTLVTAAAYPLAVKAFNAGDVEGARGQLSANSALLLLVLAPAVAGVIAINEPMTRLLVAKEFQQASIAILPAAIIGAGLRNMRVHGWDQLYLLFEAQKAMLLFEAIEVVAVIAASIFGFLWGGLEGAVLANALAAGAVVLADYLYLRARFGLHAPFGIYARIVLAAGFMLGVLRLVPRLGYPLEASWGGILVAVLTGACLYVAALALLFPAERARVLAKLRRDGA